jgi:HEPN domain-containing protein
MQRTRKSSKRKTQQEFFNRALAKAENDLKTAAHTLKLGADCPTDAVCFHAQQTVEKYLKALLVLRGIDFPKTHDIEELTGLVAPADRPDISEDEQARLTGLWARFSMT